MTNDAEIDIEDEEASESGNSKLRKQLKEEQRARQDAEERANANEAAARRVAFMDAGIPDSPQTRFFMENYRGDLNGEAIRAAAQVHGFMAAEEAETRADVQGIEAMSQVAQGADSPEQAGSAEEMDRRMREAAENAYKNGENVGEAVAAVQRAYNRPTSLDTI